MAACPGLLSQRLACNGQLLLLLSSLFSFSFSGRPKAALNQSAGRQLEVSQAGYHIKVGIRLKFDDADDEL